MLAKKQTKKTDDSIKKLRLLSTNINIDCNFVVCIGQDLLDAKIVPTIFITTLHDLFSDVCRADAWTIMKKYVNARKPT